jgi:hypothetical protein
VIRRKGLESVTIDNLVDELVVRGRATVHPRIKEDLVERIKQYTKEEGM